MPVMRYPTNLDTLTQKLHFQRILGSVNACKYFDLITRFLSLKVRKHDFETLVIATIGTENLHLHNHFLISILKAACLRNTAFQRQRTVEGSLNAQAPNGCNDLCKDRLPRQKTVERLLNAKTPNGCKNLKFVCKNRLHSIQKCKMPNLRGHRVKVGPSPLGLPGKSSRIGIENSAPKIEEQQSNIPLGLPVKSSSIGIGNAAPKIQEQQSNIPLGLPEKSSNSIGIEDSAPKIHEQQSNIPLGLPGKSRSIGIENSTPKIHKQQSNIPPGLPGMSSSIGIEDSAPKIQEQQSNILLGLPGKSSSIEIEDSDIETHKQQSNIPLGLPEKRSSNGTVNSAPKIHEHQCNILLGLPGKISSIQIEDSAPETHEQQSNIPLGLPGKSSTNGIVNSSPKFHEQQSNIDLHYVPRMLPTSEILAITRSRLPAPLAIPTYNGRAQKVLHKRLQSGTIIDTCESTGQLPDTQCLEKRLKINLETEGLEISADAANLMNNALDVYLKRLIKPCLDLSASKSVKTISHPTRLGLEQLPRSRSASSSISDFRTAIGMNPTILGENWSQRFEELCLSTSEE